MVIQQVMIVSLQRVFRVSEITIGPFGYVFTKDLSWFAEELKLYNAMIVTLCAAYTFVQGGHVRVDLVYSAVKYRTKRVIDMAASLFFVLPFMTIVWMFGWYFLWRHLVTPKVSVTDKLEILMRKAKIMKWNVETIGFSPNGFDGYFLFKVLLVAFCRADVPAGPCVLLPQSSRVSGRARILRQTSGSRSARCRGRSTVPRSWRRRTRR